ncbi:MAG: hypothetical protein QGH42_12360 [Kiritimatiellia bacterium]|nr:hypothetical protein [Kiritimatiellia bacterium]MDP7025017.1 hypothetical protein [Kiritimatiellia bacterium]
MLLGTPADDVATGWTRMVSARRSRKVEAHLKLCAACKQWLADYQAIQQLAANALPDGQPSEKVLINIRREGRVQTADAPAHKGATPWLRPAYGLATVAAVCLVLVGAWWMKPDQVGFGNEAQLSTIMLMLSEDTVSLDEETTALSADVEEVASLDTLAQQLLTLQGLDAGYTEAELSTPVEELPATDPLTRSTSAFRAGRYG